MLKCHCEQEKHFDPHNEGHPYGVHKENVEPVKLISGTFDLCPDCREHCFPEDSSFRVPA